MSFVLDAIRKKLLLDNDTVDSNISTPSVDVDDREASFSVSVTWQNGSNLDATIYLQVSNDNINFVDMTDSSQTISDASGVHIWDIADTGASYLRVRFEVVDGSADFTILYVGKRRH